MKILRILLVHGDHVLCDPRKQKEYSKVPRHWRFDFVPAAKALDIWERGSEMYDLVIVPARSPSNQGRPLYERMLEIRQVPMVLLYIDSSVKPRPDQLPQGNVKLVQRDWSAGTLTEAVNELMHQPATV